MIFLRYFLLSTWKGLYAIFFVVIPLCYGPSHEFCQCRTLGLELSFIVPASGITIHLPRQQKFRAMNGAHLASPIRGELGYAHWPQLHGNPIYCPIGHKIWGPLGKQDVCPNFALTAAKFVFSNSGNFRAMANPPKSCPKRP